MPRLKTRSNIWRPETFQGTGKKTPYFEGWFFKAVSADRTHVWAFIPGVYWAPNPQDSHAFIMVLDGTHHHSTFHRFRLDDFSASRQKLDIRLGANRFTKDGMILNIDDSSRQIKGEIECGRMQPWPRRLTSPGAMGWYAFLPFMECYHGVLGFDHPVAGRLQIDGTSHSFDGGRGYVEKDWGRSFPRAYIWMQSNHFFTPGVSLMASVARIPWLNKDFNGVLIGLKLPQAFYRFATYTGAKLQACEVFKKQVRVIVRQRRYRLELIADRTPTGELHAPTGSGMVKVSESLNSRLDVHLQQRAGSTWKTVLKDSGECAGLDTNGALELITTSNG